MRHLLLARAAAVFVFACGAFVSVAERTQAQVQIQPGVQPAQVQAGVQPGQIVISEVRFRGPAGVTDEFIEFYNNTDADMFVRTSDDSAGWALVASDGQIRFVIPAGTVIPARGHFLAANSNGYSLSAYPAGDPPIRVIIIGEIEEEPPGPFGTATPDITYTAEIADRGGVALFRTSDPDQLGIANRLDAFGFSDAPELYREGDGVETPGVSDRQSSFYRDLSRNLPKDTDDNAADFLLVGAPADITGNLLGAPGPENLSSPVQRNAAFPVALLDPQLPASSAPNRERSLAPVQNGEQGTLFIRRTFTNNTGKPVTRLRFRVIDITTLGSPQTCGANAASACADLRVLSSGDGQAASPNIGTVQVRGVTLEEPPEQDSFTGGGFNSSLSANFINIVTPMQPGETVRLQFALGIQRTGSFRFFVNIEALTGEFVDEIPPPDAVGRRGRRLDALR